MIVGEAANRLLRMLELTDSDEYSSDRAVEHINQAIFEIAEDAEFKVFNKFSKYELDVENLNTESYWTAMPGRIPIATLINAGFSGFSYLKKAWIDYDGEQLANFDGVDIREALDEYADTDGTPLVYAVEADYFYLRPIPLAGDTYTIRTLWSALPSEYGSGDEPLLMAQSPYAVLYKAALIASMWLMDDDRATRFDKLATRATERYAVRNSMTGDHAREVSEYNG